MSAVYRDPFRLLRPPPRSSIAFFTTRSTTQTDLTMAAPPRISTRSLSTTHRRRFLFAVVYLCLVSLRTCVATEVKWQAATETAGDHPAHTAPRSQRYWDKHGIERPDYAKTDAELASKNNDGKTWSLAGILFLVSSLVGIVAGLWVRQAGQPLQSSGTRLGSTQQQQHSTSGNMLNWLLGSSQGTNSDAIGPDEKARQARLAHFEGKLD
jgi:hypothetical protein